MRHLRNHVILFFLLLIEARRLWRRGERGAGCPRIICLICNPVFVALFFIYFYILVRTVLTAVRIECPVYGRSIRLVND